jgi:hypothetical protein
MNITATIPADTQSQLAQLRHGWMFVGAAFQADDEHCDSCSYHKVIGRINYEGVHRVYVEGAGCTLGNKDGTPRTVPSLCRASGKRGRLVSHLRSMWRRAASRALLGFLRFQRDTSHPMSPFMPRLVIRINSLERRAK